MASNSIREGDYKIPLGESEWDAAETLQSCHEGHGRFFAVRRVATRALESPGGNPVSGEIRGAFRGTRPWVLFAKYPEIRG